MNRRLLVVIAALSWPGSLVAQDRIEQIRQDANAPESSSTPDDSRSNRRRQDREGDSSGDDFFGSIFLQCLALPFGLPQLILHDHFDCGGQFLRYPYADQFPGYVWMGDWPDHGRNGTHRGDLPEMRSWSLRFSAEDGNDFNGMNRLGFRVALDAESRFGIQSNWNYLCERPGTDLHDQTLLGDTSVIYRFAQNERAGFYAGLGARLLTDPLTTKSGFDFVYGFDWLPAKPWVFSSLFDTGTVGSAWIIHGRATVGATYRHFELFGGYDFMRIGTVNVQGPLIGLRLWF